ncbi:MAG: peptidyl-prolyl cis-trans isomerase [Legionellales bacterium]|nr:peptidyl-prolyl cis-trans isomerase [Legionellales bacterium]
MITIKTTLGDIKIELDHENTPITVENFLNYVKQGFYEGTVFHRVINNFMIQGGGLTDNLDRKETLDPIENEADKGKSNKRGTIAMARTNDPHSATSQFFINVKDNDFLDFKTKSPSGWGYCVFGEVVEGMDVVDAIKSTPTTSRDGYQDVPKETIYITAILETVDA